jgi:hypothetical protein
MKVTIVEQIQSNHLWLGLVAAANGMIESELGDNGDTAAVDWETFPGDDRRPRFKVTLRCGVPVGHSILFVDFNSPTELRRQIVKLCDQCRQGR